MPSISLKAKGTLAGKRAVSKTVGCDTTRGEKPELRLHVQISSRLDLQTQTDGSQLVIGDFCSGPTNAMKVAPSQRRLQCDTAVFAHVHLERCSDCFGKLVLAKSLALPKGPEPPGQFSFWYFNPCGFPRHHLNPHPRHGMT
jgi:hypothetical protein